MITGGVVWAAVYNLLWGVAWFLFMRQEWLHAFGAIKSPLLFTADVWILWITLTLPIGAAVVAYVASPARRGAARQSAVGAGMTLWLVMTLGMATWGRRSALPIRVISLDSIVNLIALVSASLASTWKPRQCDPWRAGQPSGKQPVPDER